jgi:subtilisin-like proprotein convertase family protein
MLDAAVDYGNSYTYFVNAISYAAANADVINCSWTCGYAAPFLPVIQQAVTTGRHGLGTTTVFAAGNGGTDVALEGIQDDYQVISVAMTDAIGDTENDSNNGAGLLTSAAGYPIDILTTTGGVGTISTVGGGTSNAAPIVAGTVAMMYQVNPGLGWRDVQEIVADSSYALPGTSGTFTVNGGGGWNGGGMEFSDVEGFGELDANVAVNLARAWTEVSTSSNQVTGTASSTQTLTGAIGQGTLAFGQGIRVQHVQVTLGSSSWIQTGASLILVSPDGTRSVLLNGTTSFSGSSPIDSNAFWGENAKGNWTLIEQGPSGDATISGWTLTVEGDATTVASPLVYTPEFASIATGTRTVVSNAGDPSSTTIDLIALPGTTSINLNGGAGMIDGVAVTVQAGLLNANADGSLGDVTLIGTAGNNILTGGDGNTVINGGGGNDTITAGCGVQRRRPVKHDH